MGSIVGSAASNVSKSSRSDSTQVTFPAISGAASGDTAYLFHAADGSGSSTVPSGWTAIDVDSGTSTDWLVASRVITGDSDYTSLNAGFDPGQGWTSIILLVRGSHTLEAFANDNDGDAIAYVYRITGFDAGDLSVIFGTADDQQVTMTPPTGWTLLENDDGTDGSNRSSSGIAYKVSAGGDEGQLAPGNGDEWSGPSDDGCASFHIRFSGIDDPDAGGTITGTSAAALPSITSAATGSITKTGSSATTLPSISASSAGVLARSGTASATLPSATASASGDIAAGSSGTAAATMPPATATASGQRVITGAASTALGPITSSAAGVRSVTSAAATVAPVPTAAAAGSITANLTATASITAPAAEASGAGVVNPIQDETGNTLLDESGEGIWGTEDAPPISGTASALFPASTASIGGARVVVASASASIPLPAIDAAGDNSLSGQVSAAIPVVTASATGQMARSGTVDATLPGLEASAAGGFALDGTADATLPAAQVSASGVVAQIVGQVAATLPVPDLASETAFTRKAAVAATIPAARANVLAGLQIFGTASATLPAARAAARDRAFRRVDLLDLWIQNGPDDVGGEALVSPVASRNDLSIYGGAYVRALLDQSGLTLQDESGDALTHVERGKPAGAAVDLDRDAANRAEIDQRGGNIARTVGGPTLVDV